MGRHILHVDQNCFYASVEMQRHPELRDKPLAVCGSQEERHGIVLAKDYLAKTAGVKTGDPLWLARQKCPGIVFVSPNFPRYLHFSQMAREIFGEYTDQVEPFGLDEAWLDVSGSRTLWGGGETIAMEIRRRIKRELGITVSVGVSFNKVFAKLGSDYKKPDATTSITRENYRQLVWPLPAEDLIYVGKATSAKLRGLGIETIGQLATAPVDRLERHLGKVGGMIWAWSNGLDKGAVRRAGDEPPIKSVGNSTTAPRDLVSEQDIHITLRVLCESVAARLRELDGIAKTIQISIRDNRLQSYQRQCKLPLPCCCADEFLSAAMELYRRHHVGKLPVRSLAVKACDLTFQPIRQCSLFPEEREIIQKESLDKTVEDLRARFGAFSIRRGITLTNPKLANLDPKGDHIIHPIGFLH